jgi:GNAT superfamily N-acetyltransferase
MKLEPEKIALACVIATDNLSVMAVSGDLSLGVADASVFLPRPGYWWLARLKVDARYQNQGIGTRLLRQVQDEVAKKNGVRGLIVEPGGYGSDPELLQKFYEGRGFVRQKQGYMLWRPLTAVK